MYAECDAANIGIMAARRMKSTQYVFQPRYLVRAIQGQNVDSMVLHLGRDQDEGPVMELFLDHDRRAIIMSSRNRPQFVTTL